MLVFVILHYKNILDTYECIDSLKRIKSNKRIVVVDNNSLSKDEEEKLRVLVDDVIVLNENLGFAKANNIGIRKAIEKYNPEFVMAINNDIIISDKDFINKIENDYKEYKFDLLGPKINTPGDSCNPFPVLKNREEVRKEIIRCKKLIKIYSSSILYALLKIYLQLKHSIKKPIIVTNGLNLEKNVALHGCAIVFSKKYLNKYDTAFYDDTFLYHEEEFIYQRIINDNLISIYDPNLELYHKEGSSLNSIIKTERSKKLYKEKERLKSLEKLRIQME